MKFRNSIATVFATLLLAVASFAAPITVKMPPATATFPAQPEAMTKKIDNVTFTANRLTVKETSKFYGIVVAKFDNDVTEQDVQNLMHSAIGDAQPVSTDETKIDGKSAFCVLAEDDVHMKVIFFVPIDKRTIVTVIYAQGLDTTPDPDAAKTFVDSIKFDKQ